MTKLILSVGVDEKYSQNPHFLNYLNSINKNSNFDINIVTYIGNKTLEIGYDNILTTTVSKNDIKKLTKINCLQHGEFLNGDFFNNLNDYDVICFTDGDMTIQRNLTNDEILFLKTLNDDDVYIGYNKSPNDTLYDEYFRLQPKINLNTNDYDIDLTTTKVYNTGVVVMNKKTWLKLSNLYIDSFDKINNTFEHYAKQQWLICYLLKLHKFNVIEMDYNIHNHTHYPSPLGTTNENGLIKFNNEIVLFKHRWF